MGDTIGGAVMHPKDTASGRYLQLEVFHITIKSEAWLVKLVNQVMDETHHFPRQIVFGEVDVTQGGRVDRNIFDELVVAMLD
jgi:hypothetical protein